MSGAQAKGVRLKAGKLVQAGLLRDAAAYLDPGHVYQKRLTKVYF